VSRDESGAWIARVVGVPGCHSYGRTLRQVRTRIREALSLWVDDAESAELVYEIRLPAGVRQQLRRVSTSRARATEAQREAQAALGLTALGMVEGQGLSLRDAAELMGLSHQRVQQLVEQHGRPGASPTSHVRRRSG
jgi:predicted RNase H-like HicB family nuclease